MVRDINPQRILSLFPLSFINIWRYNLWKTTKEGKGEEDISYGGYINSFNFPYNWLWW